MGFAGGGEPFGGLGGWAVGALCGQFVAARVIGVDFGNGGTHSAFFGNGQRQKFALLIVFEQQRKHRCGGGVPHTQSDVGAHGQQRIFKRQIQQLFAPFV